MGFLKDSINGKEYDASSDIEEQYERMFAKMGRDFVYKEDLEEIIRKIVERIDPEGLSGIVLDDSHARAKAYEYKDVVETGQDGSEIYVDLVKIDEDEEEEDDKKKDKDK